MSKKSYKTIILSTAILSLLAVFASSSYAYDFPTSKSYPTGSKPVQLTTADFNNDGTPDLAVADSGDKKVSVFLSQPKPLGGWSLAQAPDCAAPDFALSVGSADFDGDGVPDLSVGTRYLGVWVMPGNGDGTFRDAVSISSAAEARHLVVADFNRDGLPDIAAVDYLSGLVRVLMNTGGLAFNEGSFAAGENGAPDPNPGPVWLAVADFDRDGLPDIAVADHDAGGVAVFRGDGAGGFALTAFLATGAAPSCLGALDIDGDGNPDIAVTCTDGSSVSVFMGSGDGSFGARLDITCLNAAGLALDDFDADGKPDMAVTSAQVNGTVSVMMGKGGGTSGGPEVYNVGAWPQSITCADFNGDGLADLAVAGRDDNTLDVLFGHVRDGGALSLKQDGNVVTLSASYYSLGKPVGDGTVVKFYARYSLDGGLTWSKWASKGRAKTFGGGAVSKLIKLKKPGAWQFKATYTPKNQLPIPTNSVECEAAPAL